MAEKYVLAEKDYIKGMKFKDIAEKYEVSINTVKSWKKRFSWNRNRIAEELQISRRQAFNWRDDIVNAVGEVLGWR